ncbi:MAG: serine/threonine protein kinase [Prevotella sp.]
MEENNLFNDRYFLERLLGRGNFSEVWLAKDTKTDIHVALKIYAPATGLDDEGLNVLAREFSLVVNANHKNLLKPLYYDSCDRKPFLVLPYCPQGSIMKQVGTMSEHEAWRLLRDVASGLAWLHGMNPPVIHQDIKPDNVMIGENGDYMITDFGVSTHVKSTLRKSLSSAFSSAGTIAYMAPERFSSNNKPIMANDIYSLGATVYEMLTGDTPFGDDGGLIQMKGAAVPELRGDFSHQLKDVISRCLRLNSWERPTAEQLEQYAEAGMKGEKIVFAGEKNSFQKNRVWIIAAIVLLFVVGVVAGVATFNHNKAVAEQQEQQQIALRNDSIKSAVTRSVAAADALVSIGDAHDENFEESYLEAYRHYETALAAASKAGAGWQTKTVKEIRSKMDATASKLAQAYASFREKAKLFVDDADVAREFNDRASSISKIVDVNKYLKQK